jgi:predicted O-methyltransferase YrrM
LSEKKVAYARDAIARAGLAAVVDFRVGNALDILPGLPDSIDFVLIDLWKNLYVACLDTVYPKLASGAIVVADNMLQPEASRPEAAAYRRRVRELGLDSVLLPVGSGIEVSRKTRAD